MKLLCKYFLLFVLACVFSNDVQAITLKTSWSHDAPYRYMKGSNEARVVGGLDIDVVHAATHLMGVSVTFHKMTLGEESQALQNGTIQMAMGSKYDKSRTPYAYFSEPYRFQENCVLLKLADEERYTFANEEGLAKLIRTKTFRLGVKKDHLYDNKALNEVLNDPSLADNIEWLDSDTEGVLKLMDGRIDGLLTDRISAATVTLQQKMQSHVLERILPQKNPIFFVLSKKSTTAPLVAKLNDAIHQLQITGRLATITAHYLLPVTLLQTTAKPWFVVIDILGAVAFCISGLIIAYRERFGFFGALVMAALPAVGGGIMRDLIVGRSPIAVVDNPVYLHIILGVTLSAILIANVVTSLRGPHKESLMQSKRAALYFNNTIHFFDAIGYAAYTIIGVTVAVIKACHPLWLWGPILASITCAGGGILRDILRTDRQIVSVQGIFYAEVSLIWGFILSVFFTMQQDQNDPAVIFTGIMIVLVGTFITRLVAHHRNWQSTTFRDTGQGKKRETS